MPLDIQAVCQETGLVWPSLPSWEDWAELGPRLASVNNVSRWALADWLCTGEDLFESKADQVITALGLSYRTMQNLRWTARKVPMAVRQPLPVSFSHHALVTALAFTDQQESLATCALHQWTRDEFRDYLVHKGLLPGAVIEEDDQWRLEAGPALEATLHRWYRTSDLDISMLEIWSREREALVADLLAIVERFRR